MKIALIFSYKNSIKSWHEAGVLNRELEIFRLLNKKYNFRYCFITYGSHDDKDLINENFIEVIPLYEYFKKSKFNILNILASLTYPLRMKKLLSDVNVIQQNQINGSWVAIVLYLVTKKPVFVRTGYDLVLFSINNKKNWFKIFSYKFLTSLSLKVSSLYTVTSKEDFNHLIENFKFDNSKLKIRRNWVISSKSGGDFYTKKILCVGRLEFQKNYIKIIKDFQNTKDSLTIDIVGKGSEKSNLLKLANEYNVNINFLGKIENSKLKSLYGKYRFFVTASLFEGNPKSLLEAMGAGCIVLASNIANHRELIDNEVDGFLINLNTESFYERYNQIKNNENLLNKVSSSSIKRIEENNNINKISFQIYSDLMSIND